MAQFYAEINNGRNPTHRLGHKTSGCKVTLRGWDSGVVVYAKHEDGHDILTVLSTGGSNDPGEKLPLVTLIDGRPIFESIG